MKHFVFQILDVASAAGFAESLSSLGGRTLAQYVADHQAHAFGLVRG